ncbi:hypothetical protein [Lysinibacillus sp. NPDC086135]|uniref:hypothetical protein n=1 Tax=Lysinibacillus sp. NPDC086135 TaxID=3364130 RepID=UPI00382BC216
MLNKKELVKDLVAVSGYYEDQMNLTENDEEKANYRGTVSILNTVIGEIEKGVYDCK